MEHLEIKVTVTVTDMDTAMDTAMGIQKTTTVMTALRVVNSTHEIGLKRNRYWTMVGSHYFMVDFC